MSTIRQKLAVLLCTLLAAALPVSAAPVHELVASFDTPPKNPGYGALVLGPDGDYWGTTINGGAYNYGTIYKVKADGSDLRMVHSFIEQGTANKGSDPYAGLVSDGAGSLWGTTSGIDTQNYGAVFKVNASTGVLTTLVQFTYDGATNKGSAPYAGLVSDGAGSFWGTTSGRWTYGHGTVFKVDASTGVLTTLVEFTNNGATNKGSAPYAGLVSDGAGSFWGTTYSGGASNIGTVFKVNASTGVLTTLVQFTTNGATNKGSQPYGALVSDGAGFLWGTTSSGGANGDGTVFKVNASTGVLTTLVQFIANGATNKGRKPYAGLVSDGAGSFVGTTSEGGANGFGTVFKVNASTGVLTTLVQFTTIGATNKGSFPAPELVSDGAGSLWGTTQPSDGNGYGTVFKVNASTGVLTTLVEFTYNGATNKGSDPYAGLLADGAGFFWGTTSSGGANGYGTVFKVNASTGVLTTLVQFSSNGATNKGGGPRAGLVSDGAGSFWGTTILGGANDYGTVFKVNASTAVLTTLVEFTGNGATNKGRNPVAGLVSDGAGSFWGTTSEGGANGYGTVFKVNASTGVLTTLVEFTSNGATNKGAYPYAGLVSDGAGSLWGTTIRGGAPDSGTVYKVNASTGVLTTLVEFTGNGATNEGIFPYARLVSDDEGSFWGTTYSGGANGYGTVYKVNASTAVLTTLVEFTDNGTTNKGSSPHGSLLKHSDGNFYGTTTNGGPGGAGTIYRLRLGPTPATQTATPVSITTATLNGTLNPNGLATTAAFEWGTDATLTTSTLASAGTTTTGTAAEPVSAALTGLTPNTTYYYRVRGVNADNTIPQRGAILSFTTPSATPLQSWKLAHLGNANAPDTDDPDGDGLLTLAEYGLSLLPETPSSAPSVSAFDYAEGRRLQIFIQRDPTHNDVTVEVQTADSVTGTWNTVATSTLGAPFTGPGYVGGDSATPGTKTVEVRDTADMNTAPQRFMRVKVTR